MHRSAAGPAVVVAALAASACSASRSTIPPVISIPAESLDTEGRAPMRLLLIPGRYKYQFVQNTRITADTATNPAPSTVSTTARLLVEISQRPDSSFHVSVSTDSVQLTTQGQIPARPAITPIGLGLVLEASVQGGNMSVLSQLPDSLCAYSHFVTVARQLLLPRLPNEVSSQPSLTQDTSTISTCRAGTHIETTIIQQLVKQDSRPNQVTLREATTLSGIGVLGRDSITVSGSITSEGLASFSGHSRLPTIVESHSEGLITVRVGASTTSFRQISTQQIRQEEQHPPPN